MEKRKISANSEPTIVLRNNHDLTCLLGHLVDNIMNFETVKLLLEFWHQDQNCLLGHLVDNILNFYRASSSCLSFGMRDTATGKKPRVATEPHFL